MDSPSRPPTAKSRLWRWWRLQFGIRSLLGLMLLSGLVMGWWRWFQHSYVEQQEALAVVAPLAKFAGTKPGRPEWLRPLFAEDVYQDVRHLAFDSVKKFGDAEAAQLANFPRLNRLSLDGTSITDEALSHLSGLSELDTLSLNETSVTSTGLAHLRGLKNPKHLELGRTRIDGAGLAHLAGMKKLELLELNSLPIEDEHLASLVGLTQLRILQLHRTKIRGDGLAGLKGLPNLSDLEVSGVGRLTRVEIQGFQSLRKLSVWFPPEGQGTCIVKNCPELVRLDIQGGKDRIELEDLPKLAGFEFNNQERFAATMVMHSRTREPVVQLPVTLRFVDLPQLSLLQIHHLEEGPLTLAIRELPSLTQLDIFSRAKLDAAIQDSPLVEALTLGSCDVNDSLQESLRQLSSVKKLVLNDVNSPRLVLESLPRADRLESLKIGSVGAYNNTWYTPRRPVRISTSPHKLPVAASELSPLSALKNLRILELTGCRFAEGSLGFLADLPALEELTLARSEIEGAQLASFASLRRLEKLKFDDVPLSSDSLVHLYGLPRLKSLEFSGQHASDAEYRALSAALPPDCRLIVRAESVHFYVATIEFMGGRPSKVEDDKMGPTRNLPKPAAPQSPTKEGEDDRE